MQREGVIPDAIINSSILNQCASSGALKWVKEVHACSVQAGLEKDVRVGSALINMYWKSGNIEDAREVFDSLKKRDIIVWNVMSGRGYEAFVLFLRIQQEGFVPDACTYTSILNQNASMGAVEWVKEVHSCASNSILKSDVRVGDAFVNMYAKTGEIEQARRVFDGMTTRDVISWTEMVIGLAEHGCGEEALQVFDRMKSEGVIPNKITFVGVLSACSHAGLLSAGKHHFLSMSEGYGIVPTVEYHNCMVGMLSRAGHLNEAADLIKNMPIAPCQLGDPCSELVGLPEMWNWVYILLEPDNAGV
jgi:pentatricopeptide repeat protein